MFFDFEAPYSNKYTRILIRLQKELHYSDSEMVKYFPHLLKKQSEENLRLMKRRARVRRYKLIGK